MPTYSTSAGRICEDDDDDVELQSVIDREPSSFAKRLSAPDTNITIESVKADTNGDGTLDDDVPLLGAHSPWTWRGVCVWKFFKDIHLYLLFVTSLGVFFIFAAFMLVLKGAYENAGMNGNYSSCNKDLGLGDLNDVRRSGLCKSLYVVPAISVPCLFLALCYGVYHYYYLLNQPENAWIPKPGKRDCAETCSSTTMGCYWCCCCHSECCLPSCIQTPNRYTIAKSTGNAAGMWKQP